MRKYWHTAATLFSGLVMILLTAAFLMAIPRAHSAELQRGHAWVEAFGAYAWPGNISSAGETNPVETITLERSGEYAFGGGAGYVFPSGVHVGGKVRYVRHGCDEDAGEGECAVLVEGHELEFATLGVLATVGYTVDTGLIIDPFAEFDAGLGYVSMICEDADDGCPTGSPRGGNYGDIGFQWGFCGGFKGPITDDRRLEFVADACWHRNESAAPHGVPHPDAMDAITAGLRLRARL